MPLWKQIQAANDASPTKHTLKRGSIPSLNSTQPCSTEVDLLRSEGGGGRVGGAGFGGSREDVLPFSTLPSARLLASGISAKFWYDPRTRSLS